MNFLSVFLFHKNILWHIFYEVIVLSGKLILFFEAEIRWFAKTKFRVPAKL